MPLNDISVFLQAAIIALLVVVTVMLCILIKKSKTQNNENEKIGRLMADEFERNRREMSAGQNDMRAQTAQSLGEMAKKLYEMTRTNF